MRKNKHRFALILTICLTLSLFAQTRDIVLQNGQNGYAGCEETSLLSSDPTGVYGEYDFCLLTYEECAT